MAFLSTTQLAACFGWVGALFSQFPSFNSTVVHLHYTLPDYLLFAHGSDIMVAFQVINNTSLPHA